MRSSAGKGIGLSEISSNAEFERKVLCHLDAAYNLARWLTGSDHEADDAVQEACLRAHKAFHQFQDGNARAWLLAIVRNVSWTHLERRNTERRRLADLDDAHQTVDAGAGPADRVVQSAEVQRLHEAIASLDVEFREVIVLREMDGLSYKEVAAVTGVPMGTVMSRLSRARLQLADILVNDRATVSLGHRRTLP